MPEETAAPETPIADRVAKLEKEQNDLRAEVGRLKKRNRESA